MRIIDGMIGTVVAGAVLAITYVGLLWTSGRPVYATPDPLAAHTTEQLVQLARDDNSPDQVAAILKLSEDQDNLAFTVPFLAELAIHHKSAIREAASLALSEIGEAALPHLRPLFSTQMQLNDDGIPSNLRQLRQDRAMACAAIQAIGEGCDIFTPDLASLIESDDEGLRKCALFALQGMGSDAEPLLDGVIACLHDVDFNNQCSACRVIESLGPKAARAESALLDILEKGNPSVRGWAAICLGAINQSDSATENARRIAEKMKQASPVEMERLLRGLAAMGPDAAHVSDAVREQLTNWDRYVEAHAAIALWRIEGDLDLAMKVIGNLLRSNGYEQDGLSIIISQMGPEALPLLPAVRAHVNSPDPITRELCAAALGSMGSNAKVARGDLETLLGDEDALVRFAARQALQKIEVAVAD